MPGRVPEANELPVQKRGVLGALPHVQAFEVQSEGRTQDHLRRGL